MGEEERDSEEEFRYRKKGIEAESEEEEEVEGEEFAQMTLSFVSSSDRKHSLIVDGPSAGRRTCNICPHQNIISITSLCCHCHCRFLATANAAASASVLKSLNL